MMVNDSSALNFIDYAYAGDSPRFGIGGFAGLTTSITGEAVEHYQNTEWGTGVAFGGRIDSVWDYNNGNKDDLTLLVSNFQGLVG